MSKGSVLERIKRAKAELEKSGGSYDNNDNIFMDIKEEGTYHVRLINDWVEVHTHFIGNGKFTPVKLYPDRAFEGENRLKKMINCVNFDPRTEIERENKKCVICRLNEVANEIINDRNSGAGEEEINWLKDIRKETFPKTRYLFCCIDRDNPEVSPGKKGIKIVEFPKKLFQQYLNLVEKNQDLDFTSQEGEAPELDIEVTGQGKDAVYSINFVMEGRQVKLTELTDEEKKLKVPDIYQISCQMPKQKPLFDRLNSDVKELIDDFVVEDESNSSEKEESSEKDESPKRRSSADVKTSRMQERESGTRDDEEDNEEKQNVPF